MGIKCRMVEKTGERLYLRVFWGNGVHGSQYGYHNATNRFKDYAGKDQSFASREISTKAEHDQYGDSNSMSTITYAWPDKCEQCGEQAPAFKEGLRSWPIKEGEACYQYFYKTLYGEPPRELEPGDMFWVSWMPESLDPRGHLCVVLPNGEIFDTMQIASNCSHNNPEQHQCWSRSGEPPDITLSPSILVGNYHGFLKDGTFEP